MPQNPESLFELVRPGDVVTFNDGRGSTRRGVVAIVNRPAGLVVVNVGGRYGTPVCVAAASLITVSPKHRRDLAALTIR